jgi:putative transposase
MSQTSSPSMQRGYGLARVCRVWEVARSTVYFTQARQTAPPKPAQKRGPKSRWSDEVLLEKIREVLTASPFLGEGHRTVGAPALARSADVQGPDPAPDARGEAAGAHAGGPRAPAGRARRDDHHGGARPDVGDGRDELSDAPGGTATVFVVVDHGASECMGVHAAKPGTRFEAVEPLRQGVRGSFGAMSRGSPAGCRRGTITAAST